MSSMGHDLASARIPAYEAVRKIRLEGAHYRTDIGRIRKQSSEAAIAHAVGEMRENQ